MKNKIFLACLSFSCLALFVGCGKKDSSGSTLTLLKEKIGTEAIDSIGEAEFVEVEDIEPSKSGYAFTGYGKPLSKNNALELKQLLLNDNSFEFTKMKSCLFIPKLAFHFKKNNKTLLTILYSPWCKQLKVIEQDQEALLEADAIDGEIEEIIHSEVGRK